MTFIEAATQVLRKSNKAMSANEIWNEIQESNLYDSSGKTPHLSLNTIMLSSSNNSNIKNKSKISFFTIVEKSPIKFKLIDECESIIEEDFDLNDDEIISNFKKITEATLEISKCINDVDHLCESLNKVDRNYLHKYYNSDKSGVVIDIRKDVAREVLLSSITSERINEIIIEHKSNNSQSLKAWANPYKIVHPLINHKYLELDNFVEKFTKYILSMFDGGLKTTISNFNGSQHQGSDNYWIAIYNESHKKQSDGLQLFFDFKEGLFTCGIYNFFENSYLSKIEFDGDLKKLYDFIKVNSEYIINDNERSDDVFLKRVIKLIESECNTGMTIKEILVSLDSNLSESNLRKLLEESIDLEIIDDKWKIKGQIPGTNKLKNYLTEQGFITMDMLIDILEKNGIKLDNIKL